MKSNRREFMKSAVAAAAVASSPASAAPGTLPTIRLGKHEITRLIAGSNPQYGFSHFNRLFDQHMRDYHTQERVVEFLRALEANGINTWQASFQERTGPDLARFREQGGKIQWICLYNPRPLESPRLKDIIGFGPIAIVQHGWLTDQLFRAGEYQKSKDFLKKIRDTGVLVGLSTHNPATIDRVESENWDVDFFMTCFHYVTRTREEIQKRLGEAPLGEVYLPSDPARMCATIRQSKKTCLAYKILAAGRKTDTPEERSAAFEFAFKNIKSSDAVIVGMYNRYSDQVSENAALVRTLLPG